MRKQEMFNNVNISSTILLVNEPDVFFIILGFTTSLMQK